ncbi:MAG: hypothetical protein R2861_00015 [Desulfobacterales bacterium]
MRENLQGKQPLLTWAVCVSLCAGICACSVLSPWIYQWFIIPALGTDYEAAYTTGFGIIQNTFGVFAVFPLSVIAILVLSSPFWQCGAPGKAVSPCLI